jgi:S-DNA-T family DNA segregation ATPase FtsK/SpoIIIE
MQMPPGVPINKITARADDIALCFAAEGIRIEAPIPGKSLLGIEVPNRKRQKVGLKQVIDSQEFMSQKSPVAFALGKDIAGKNHIFDLAKMVHLLVAGATGSGKSVCLNTLIISILYKASPEDVRLILVDPKRVEFNIYNGLPHLMLKNVITNAEKAISAFNWAINEMDRRFDLFQESNTRDIGAYNEKIKGTDAVKLPRILIVVDELADLMMMNKSETEEKITKLAQLSRAAGIHLILATQRPSVDVITGTIKANLPSRATFKLMTQADSRTVLETSGAEKLLGEGDMVFITNGMPKPMRLQGPFISMAEVESIVEFVRANNPADFDEEIEDEILNAEDSGGEPKPDDLETGTQDRFFADAVRHAVEAGQTSISMVQRRFAVGYARAGKIIDEMEKQHLISAQDGAKPRQVLITREEFERRFGDGDG